MDDLLINNETVGAASRKVVTGSDPAANTEFSQSVPAGKYWQLLAVTVSLVQGGTQTPQPSLVIDDGATVLFASLGASSAQNASTTTRYTWAPGCALTAAGAVSICTASLPANLLLPGGYTIRSSTIGMGANTNYGAPAFYVVEVAP